MTCNTTTLLDVPTVSERLGVSVKSVRRLIAKGILRHHRPTQRCVRVSEDDLAAHIARCRG